MILIGTSSSSLIATFFFFNDTATTEIYTLSLHDALPIFRRVPMRMPANKSNKNQINQTGNKWSKWRDRKSTRLNSSHGYISYAVFCLKKKKQSEETTLPHTMVL